MILLCLHHVYGVVPRLLKLLCQTKSTYTEYHALTNTATHGSNTRAKYVRVIATASYIVKNK